MFLGDAVVHIFEASLKLWCDALLIADTEKLQAERFWVTSLSTQFAPLAVGRTVRPFDKVKSRLSPDFHILHRHCPLVLLWDVPSAVGTLAAHTAWEDRHRSCTKVFTQLEVLVIAELHCLVISPSVLELHTFFLWTHCCLPAIGVPESVATSVNHASTREAHELRLQSFECLAKILAQAMSLVCLFWQERYHIHVHHALLQCYELQACVGEVLVSLDHCLVFLPVLAIDLDGCLTEAEHLWELLHTLQHYAHVLSVASSVTQECREVVFLALLDIYTIEAFVGKTHTIPSVEVRLAVLDALNHYAHIGRVVLVELFDAAHIVDIACRVAVCHALPCCARSPTVALVRRIFERAVLYKLGIQTAIGSIADILEENTEEILTDRCTSLWGMHFLCLSAAGSQCQCGTENRFFHVFF